MTDYVTHPEFQAAMDRIDGRFAQIDMRFEQTATKADLLDLKTVLMGEIHKGVVETQRWMIATVVGLFVGFGGLFMAMSNTLKPGPVTAATTTAPPIIINVPAAPVPAAPTAKP